MDAWIFWELPCTISSVSIYYASESDIQVKTYDHLNYLRASVVHLLSSQYIIILRHTPETKVVAFWICRELPCLISSISIYYAPESDIREKSYDHLNFLRASVVHFRASRYIMGLTHTPDSKVMAVWICRELPCSISSISIYYALESDIRVKTCPLKLLESLCNSFSSGSIYNGPYTYTWDKSYCRLKLPRTCVFNFERLDKVCVGIGHPSEMLWPFEFLESLCWSFLSVSIYHGPHTYTRVKSYGHSNLSRASVVQFRASTWVMPRIGHPCEKLWPFEFL